ncbi:MAG TPA: nuclear transport factor 2 family protein [bacterium]|nr:nuclear transport factor 2 family protein [bacterium]HQL62558.1 nuclear transport factor 2 family protein [bacterium]
MMNETNEPSDSSWLVRLAQDQEIDRKSMDAFQVLRRVAEAIHGHDAQALLEEFALDDPRFSVFETSAPYRMSAEDIRGTADVLAALRDPDMRFDDVRFDCADAVAIATGYQVLRAGAKEIRRRYSSRFSLVMIPINGKWKILHAHFSAIPGTR